MRLPFSKAKITSPFGIRIHPITFKETFHYGVDFKVFDDKILACEKGTVILAKKNGGYGNCIMIQHDDCISLYGHLEKIKVKVGEIVAEGEIIGIQGSTGRSTGKHLHFGLGTLMWQPKRINPSARLGIKNKYGPIIKLDPIQILADNGFIQSPEYWTAKAKQGEMCNGEYVLELMSNIVKKL